MVSRAGLQSEPVGLGQPAAPRQPVPNRQFVAAARESSRQIEQARHDVRAASTEQSLKSVIQNAERAISAARRALDGKGAKSALRALEQEVVELRRAAAQKQQEIEEREQLERDRHGRVAAAVYDHLSPLGLGVLPPTIRADPGPSVPPAETPRNKSEQPSTIDAVLAARAVKLDSRELLAAALRNASIPSEIREELPSAMDKVQAVSSHAPGIALEHVAGLEIGRASQPGAGGTLLASTLESHGHAHGFAYEVIAVARFIDQPRHAGNGGDPVRIVKGEDQLIFGQKLPAGVDRKTVEADTLVVKPDGRKIAIDAKSYSRTFGASEGLRAELKGIQEAIRQGEVHEFHFAVRGAISSDAKDLIEQADRVLRDELRTAPQPHEAAATISQLQSRDLDLARPLICWHENLG